MLKMKNFHFIVGVDMNSLGTILAQSLDIAWCNGFEEILQICHYASKRNRVYKYSNFYTLCEVQTFKYRFTRALNTKHDSYVHRS